MNRTIQYIFFAYVANSLATIGNWLFCPYKEDANCSEGLLGETMDSFCKRYGERKRAGSLKFLERKRGAAKNKPLVIKVLNKGRGWGKVILRTYVLNKYTYCVLNFIVDVLQMVGSFKRYLFRLFSY